MIFVKEEDNLDFLKLLGLGKTHLDGYFANVVEVGDTKLALSTDGVGTKILISQMMQKYDTIGIDCVAMVVNDIICVGAIPLYFLDCLSLQTNKYYLMEQLTIGLKKGSDMAGVNISGGETAYVRDMIKGFKEGFGYDLIGMGIGVVEEDIIDGSNISDGDLIIGLESSGLHSNGYTLARKILLNEFKIDSHIPDLGRTLGEELLEPTTIYSSITNKLIASGISVKAFVNITGDGLLNLLRVNKDKIRFLITDLPKPKLIFKMIQEIGKISDIEMYETFNMGIGFCIVIDPDDYYDYRFRNILDESNLKYYDIGTVEYCEFDKKVVIPSKGLMGYDNKFIEWEDF